MIRALAAALAAAALPAGTSGPFGHGAARVWVLRPAGPVRSVVVFGHGWKSAPPSAAHPWVGQFAPWLAHLLAGGSAVVFPAYQLGGDTQGAQRADDFVAGVREGLRRLGSPRVPLVEAGYSYAAPLALAYAARARRLGLPVPRAILAVFPAEPVPGVSLAGIDPATHLVVLTGDADTVAGSGGAEAIRRLTTGLRRRTFAVVRSSPGLRADHAAPKSSAAPARRAFWAPLDALLRQAR